MAKIKLDIKIKYKDIKSKFNPWLENKIKRARKFSKPTAARAARYGALVIVSILFLITLHSYFSPQDEFEKAKRRLIRNPKNVEAHLVLAEEFLKNNDLVKAQKELIEAQKYNQSFFAKASEDKQSKVLGWTSKLYELTKRWQDQNPQQIQKLINQWEEVVSKVPTYRDGYLRLAFYYSKLGNNEKAKENVQKAIELDQSYEPAREIERIIP